MTISNDQTWAIFWFAIVVSLCVLIGSCTVMSNNEDARKAQDMKTLIAAGQSPLEARCAVYGTNSNDDKSAMVCQTVATSAAILKTQKAGAVK